MAHRGRFVIRLAPNLDLHLRKTARAKAEGEDVSPDISTLQGFTKGELATGSSNQRHEMTGSDPRPKPYVPVGGCMDEQAKYPGDRSNRAEVEGGDISTAELGPSQRFQTKGFQEMYDTSAPSAHPEELPGSLPRRSIGSGSTMVDDEYSLPAHISQRGKGHCPSMCKTEQGTSQDQPVSFSPIRHGGHIASFSEYLGQKHYSNRESRSKRRLTYFPNGSETSFETTCSEDGAEPRPARRALLTQDPNLPGKECSSSGCHLAAMEHGPAFMTSKTSPLENLYGKSSTGYGNPAGVLSPMNSDYSEGPRTISPLSRLLSPLSSTISPTSVTRTSPITENVICQDMLTVEEVISDSQAELPFMQSRHPGISHWYSANTSQRATSACRHHGPADSKAKSFNAALTPSTDTVVFDEHSALSQTQIEELRDLVEIVNEEWLQRLNSDQELWLRCSKLSVHDVFENGIKTLKQFFCGSLVKDFDEVFALMHVALASAYILHRDDDEPYRWTMFIQDALQWQLALSDNNDKALFVKVMDRWWWQIGVLSSSLPSPMLHPVIVDTFPGTDTSQSRLLDVLRSGKIIGDCMGFLEGKSPIANKLRTSSNRFSGFGEANIVERNQHISPAELTSYVRSPIGIERTKHMIKSITKPLQEKRGIEALRRNMLDAEFKLCSGLLYCPRELEITLISSGRVSLEFVIAF